MNFQYLAVSLMKPGYDDDLVTWLKAVESLSRESMYLKPRVRSALSALASGLSQAFSGWTGLWRSDEAIATFRQIKPFFFRPELAAFGVS